MSRRKLGTRAFLAVTFLLSTRGATDAQSAGDDSGGGYFGAPVLEYTRLREQDAIMAGGRGGWYVTPSLVLGGGLYGTVTEVDAPTAAVADAPGPLDVKFEKFAFDLEYHVRASSPTHFTLGASVGGAAARYARDGTDEQHGETDFMFLVEPALGVEQVVTGWLHVHLAASYRLCRGVEQAGLDADDVQGPAAVLALKLGRF